MVRGTCSPCGKKMTEGINIDEWYAANMENWYFDIEEYTFASKFLVLSVPEAKAMITHIEQGKDKTTDTELQILAHLESKIDALIDPWKTTGAFAKLSCRSPKDVTATSESMQRRYAENIAKFEKPSDNDIVVALFDAHIKVLKIHTAKEAMDLFLKSYRILEDLQLGLQNEETFNIQVIVREWLDISISHEFRGFVYNKQLNGLSQYFDFCYFPQLKDEQAKIIDACKDTFDNVRDKIKLSNFILDFALVGDKAYVIELNPWLETTDSCLFKWFKDLKVLEYGPLEFRCNTRPVPGVKGQVLSVWKHYFDSKK